MLSVCPELDNLQSLDSTVLSFFAYTVANGGLKIHRCHGISDNVWFCLDRVLQSRT